MPIPGDSGGSTPLLTPSDLTPFADDIDPAKAQAMIDDALALAGRVAPCILDDGFAYPDAAKAILRGAVLRWNDSGSGAFQSQTTGPYGAVVDTRQTRRGMFWPSEIEQLQKLCQPTGSGGAFSINVDGASSGIVHASVCPAVSGGACLCGAVQAYGYIPTGDGCW